MMEIISNRGKTLWHNHRCPICKQARYEPNEICGYSLPHVFACIPCLKDHRLRLGTDILLDTYLDQVQLDRLQKLAPDEKSDELDLEAVERAKAQLEQILKRAKEPVQIKMHKEKLQRETERAKEHPIVPDVITYDEAVSELEADRKKMEID